MIKLGVILVAMIWSGAVMASDIQVESAWARATAPGQEVAMVDMVVTSEKQAELVGFSSAACSKAEMHSMTHEAGMMKMREVKTIALPAGEQVSLSGKGYHLMLIGLKAPLKAGDRLPLTLNIKTAAQKIVKVEVEASVKPLTEVMPMEQGHMHHMH